MFSNGFGGLCNKLNAVIPVVFFLFLIFSARFNLRISCCDLPTSFTHVSRLARKST